jgi:FAD/FMN-containing dehydrogenase
MSTSTDHLAKPAEMSTLAAALSGSLYQPGDPAYLECCTIWNGMIEKRPALVVRPVNAADVVAALRFASQRSLPVSVRGGGHNVAGAALTDNGLTIDMSQRRAVRIDAAGMLVTVEAGATWKDVDAATQARGTVVPSGIISATGVAGLTLGAGFGWTSRKFGFTADNLVSATVVTPDGSIRTASAAENADLFWALRGGGGNFGVVMDFTFRGHWHGPEVMAGMVVHPYDAAPQIIEFYRDLTSRAPDELTCLLVLRKAPPAPWIPEAHHGKLIASIAAHWTGSVEDGRRAMQPLKSFGSPVADTIEPKSFTAFQSFLDGGQPFGRRYYWKSGDTPEISDGVAAALLEAGRQIASPFSAILCMHLGGAPARVPADDTAVGIRAAQYGMVFQSAWTDAVEDAAHIGWARASLQAVRPFTTGGSYVNFLTEEEGVGQVQAAYRDRIYTRLRAIKTAYDPSNLMGGPLNIPPAPAARL